MAKPVTHYLADLLASWGAVEIKRMFGGLGAWREGAFFALIADDVIYFKVDDVTRGDYVAAQSQPFSYTARRGGEESLKVINGLWRVPDEVLEDVDALQLWAQKAWDIARQKPGKSAKKRKTFKGLGTKSVAWLKSVGIGSQADLEDHGAVAAYRLLKARYPREVSLNMLWGLYASVNHLETTQLNQDIKEHLLGLLAIPMA